MAKHGSPDDWVPFSRLVEEGETHDPPAKLVRLEQGRGRILKRLFRKVDPAVPLHLAYFLVHVYEGRVTDVAYQSFRRWLFSQGGMR